MNYGYPKFELWISLNDYGYGKFIYEYRKIMFDIEKLIMDIHKYLIQSLLALHIELFYEFYTYKSDTHP